MLEFLSSDVIGFQHRVSRELSLPRAIPRWKSELSQLAAWARPSRAYNRLPVGRVSINPVIQRPARAQNPSRGLASAASYRWGRSEKSRARRLSKVNHVIRRREVCRARWPDRSIGRNRTRLACQEPVTPPACARADTGAAPREKVPAYIMRCVRAHFTAWRRRLRLWSTALSPLARNFLAPPFFPALLVLKRARASLLIFLMTAFRSRNSRLIVRGITSISSYFSRDNSWNYRAIAVSRFSLTIQCIMCLLPKFLF